MQKLPLLQCMFMASLLRIQQLLPRGFSVLVPLHNSTPILHLHIPSFAARDCAPLVPLRNLPCPHSFGFLKLQDKPQDFFSSGSAKNITVILTKAAWNLQIAFSNVAILTLSVLFTHEHGRSSHFLCHFQFLPSTSFAFLMRFVLRYFHYLRLP